MNNEPLKPIQIFAYVTNRMAQIADYSWQGDFCKEEAIRAMASAREELAAINFKSLSLEQLQDIGFRKWTDNSILCPLWAQPILKPNAKDKDVRAGCLSEGWKIKDNKVCWDEEGDIFTLDPEDDTIKDLSLVDNPELSK